MLYNNCSVFYKMFSKSFIFFDVIKDDCATEIPESFWSVQSVFGKKLSETRLKFGTSTIIDWTEQYLILIFCDYARELIRLFLITSTRTCAIVRSSFACVSLSQSTNIECFFKSWNHSSHTCVQFILHSMHFLGHCTCIWAGITMAASSVTANAMIARHTPSFLAFV